MFNKFIIITFCICLFIFPGNALGDDGKIEIEVIPESQEDKEIEKVVKAQAILEKAVITNFENAKAGVVISLEGVVMADSETGIRRWLEPGSGLEKGDKIETTADGTLAIAMPDRSIYSLASDTMLKIEDYNYDPDKLENDVCLLSLEEGIFSYYSGEMSKRSPAKIKYRTPTSVAGIRGSCGTMAYKKSAGKTWVIVTGGVAVFTDENGNALMFLPGDIVSIPSEGKPTRIGSAIDQSENFNIGQAMAVLKNDGADHETAIAIAEEAGSCHGNCGEGSIEEEEERRRLRPSYNLRDLHPASPF